MMACDESTNKTRLRIGVPDLPEDIFLLILAYLETWDLCRCQMVSKTWQTAFSQDRYIQCVLNGHGNVRELQQYRLSNDQQPLIEWIRILNTVASRYFHLTRGRARKIDKYEITALDQYGFWYPIGQWDYHESQPGGRLYSETAAKHLNRVGQKPYLFPPTLWTYEDGLIVYAPVKSSLKSLDNVLHVLDVATKSHYPVPFSLLGRLIRNIRLKDRTLIIEWAEKHPYHDLNAAEKVHRHFVSCFDVVFNDNGASTWTVKFRSEWKSHFLGLPLSSRDRFFSTHNDKYYAKYLWQPNRSMYTGDEDLPIEALFVWDISMPSSYQPSQDPTGRNRPADDFGPHMVARFAFRELDFLGIRQHSNIALTSMHVHSDSQSLTIRQNVCENGQGYFDPAERLWCATTTTFPFSGEGPCYHRTYDGDLPPYRGHCTMESVDTEEAERWFLPVMDVYDELADVRFSLVETCFTGTMIENKILIRIKALESWETMNDDITKDLGAMGRIAGDERWLVGQNSRMELVVAKFQ